MLQLQDEQLSECSWLVSELENFTVKIADSALSFSFLAAITRGSYVLFLIYYILLSFRVYMSNLRT